MPWRRPRLTAKSMQGLKGVRHKTRKTTFVMQPEVQSFWFENSKSFCFSIYMFNDTIEKPILFININRLITFSPIEHCWTVWTYLDWHKLVFPCLEHVFNYTCIYTCKCIYSTFIQDNVPIYINVIVYFHILISTLLQLYITLVILV